MPRATTPAPATRTPHRRTTPRRLLDHATGDRPPVGTVCESCRRRPATQLWSQPRAGTPFAVCGPCAEVLPAAGTGARS